MKKMLFFAGLLLIGWSRASADYPAQMNAGVSFDVFYSSLGPQGEWLYVDDGVYAWHPLHVAAGWRPYSYGHWVWTDEGWYWVSDEPWGWAVYHYGRWYYDDYYGWVWIPGYDWAPAWVEWRYGGLYVGWAPLSPYAVFNVSYGIYYRRRWETPYDYWLFTDCRYMGSPEVNRYVYRTDNNARFIEDTRTAGSVRVIGNRVVTRGPEREYVERRGGVRIQWADIVTADRPQERVIRSGGTERVEVYRPRVEAARQGNAVVRPERVRDTRRAFSIDTKQIDLMSRAPERPAVREPERTESGRPEAIERRSEPAVRTQQGTRSEEQARPRYDARSGRERSTVQQPQQQRRVEQPRVQRQEIRRPAPDRAARRPEARPQQRPQQPQRGGDRKR